METPVADSVSKRRYRERIIVITALVLVVFFGFLEGWFFRTQSQLPVSGNILLFAFININVILLLLLAYLVLRNIVKLIFERKRNILGHKLRTRLVFASVGLTLIPTIPLFWLATQFIFSSLDHWFSRQVEHSLEQSVVLAKDYLEREGKSLITDSRILRGQLQNAPDTLAQPSRSPISLLNDYRMDALFLLNVRGEVLYQARRPKVSPIQRTTLHGVVANQDEETWKLITIDQKSMREGLFVHCRLSAPEGTDDGDAAVELVAMRQVPLHIAKKMEDITSGYEDYLQLKLLHIPLKRSHFFTFSIVTLLTIFAAVWFGFFLAKSLTVPIQALVAATQRIAEGDLNVQVDHERNDELGMLIYSFNGMVRDLKESREKLASAYDALQQSHLELEDRRRYMEIVLRDVAAGVVSVDALGRIMTLNKSAGALFGLRADEVRGRSYADFLQPAHMDIVKSFMEKYASSGSPYLEQQVQVMVCNRPMTLFIKVSILHDELENYMGVVVVLDDLTDLEKAQRMAAWREVARRIAHEIKNPLTPIKLSAQRLRRKHADFLETGGTVFDECTRTIIQQVDHMKHLVNEFSRFARLPRAQPMPCSLSSIVEESLSLYRHSYPHIEFRLVRKGEMPPLKLDTDQFRQVMNNLIENSMHAINGRGSVEIRLSYDTDLKIARLECADTGHGLSPEDKHRMFEPYYSTKEKGSGLGLAIVANIIADHNGFIRVDDNTPRGTVIIIELPG